MFKSTSAMVWLGREKEKHALKLCKKHMDRVVKVVEGMREAVYHLCDYEKDKLKTISKEVIKLERDADSTKGSILKELSKGVFHPISREEIIRLVLTADNVAENARAVGKKAVLLQTKELKSVCQFGILGEHMKTHADDVLKIVKVLRTAYSALLEDPKEAIEITFKVENMEEKIDSFRGKKLIPEIIDWCDRSGKPGSCIVLKDMTDNMEQVADYSEDVADVIRSIAIGSL